MPYISPSESPAPAPAAADNTPAPKPSFFDSVKSFFGGAPAEAKTVAPAAPAKTGYVSPAAAPKDTPPAASKGYVSPSIEPKDTGDYFYKKFDTGATIGKSDQIDASGKPLFAYRNPGDTSTTTDKTRIATKFDPTVPKAMDSNDFYNPRDPNVTKLRGAMGATYNQELDHKIALELAGSNDKENLQPETAINPDARYSSTNPTPTDALENKLAREVAKGQKSLIDAQIELSKAKGLKSPWKPPAGKTSPTTDAWQGFKDSVKGIFATPVEAAEIPKGYVSPADVKPTVPAKPAKPVVPEPSVAYKAAKRSDGSTINAPGQKNALHSEATPDKFKGQTISQKQEKEDPWYVAAGKAAADTVTGSLEDAGKRLSDFTYSLMGLSGEQDKKGQMAKAPEEGQVLDRVTKGVTAGLGIVNAVFSPLTGAIKAGEHIPFVAPVAKGINKGFEFVGAVVEPNAKLLVNSLPISDETKTKIQPVVTELLTTLAQAAAGKMAHDVAAPKVVALTQDIKNLAKESFTAATKDKTTIVTPAGDIFIHPDTIRDYIAGREITDQEATDLYKTLGRTADQIRKDVVNGVNIEVPAKTVEILKDKPYWSAVKDLFTGRANGEPIPNAQGGFAKNPFAAKEPAPGEAKGKESAPTASEEKKSALEPYKPSGDLTLKTLDKLSGKTEVSKQFISDLSKNQDLKGPERDVLTKVLADYPDGKDVPVKEFAEKVQSELLQLKQSTVSATMQEGKYPTSFNGKGDRTRYSSIALKDEARGDVQSYHEKIYQSPVKTSAASVHFGRYTGGEEYPNYFAHARIEDLARGSHESLDSVGGTGKTRRVIELQSDLFQKSRLENEQGFFKNGAEAERSIMSGQSFPRDEEVIYKGIKYSIEGHDPTAKIMSLKRLSANGKKYGPRVEVPDSELSDFIKKYAKKTSATIDARAVELKKLEPYRNTWHERIIREEIKQAAKDGKAKLQFPTGETAMKIEGLGDRHSFSLVRGSDLHAGSLNADYIKTGMEIYDGRSKWIITDLLGDGKFKAVPGGNAIIDTDSAKALKEGRYSDIPDHHKETFDISGKVDQNNPIFKFYEKEVGRYLAKKYGAKRITDAQGVSWYEMDVPKDAAKKPIQAYKHKPLLSDLNGPKISKSEALKIIEDATKEAGLGVPVKVIFTDKFINGVATGKYEMKDNPLRDEVRHLITLYEENGKVGMSTVYHEAGHYLFNNILSDADRSEAFALAKENMGPIQKALYVTDGYKGNEIFEEYLMDEYARQKRSENGFEGPFEKIFRKIDAVLKKIADAVKKILARIDKMVEERGGGKRGFIKNPLAEPNEEPGKRISSGTKETTVDEANRRYVAAESKNALEKSHADAVAAAKADPGLEELKVKLSTLQETLDNHPGAGLLKYTNRATGELPEVTGEQGTIFGQRGDDIVTELGFKDSEEARASIDDVRSLQKQIKETRQEIQDKKLEIRDKVKALEDERVMGNVTAKSEKHISDLIAKQERVLRMRELEEEGQRKAKAEEEKRTTLQEKIDKEKLEATNKISFIGRIKQNLFPIKALDPKTQAIVKKWYTDVAEGTEAAQTTWKELRAKGSQAWKEVLDYEAGKKTPWIFEAEEDLYSRARQEGIYVRHIEDHIMHVWDKTGRAFIRAAELYLKDKGLTPQEVRAYISGQPLSKEQSARLRLRPDFVKARIFPDYKTGIQYGLRPKFYTPAQIIAYETEMLNRSIANKHFIDDLKSEAKLLPEDDKPDGWLPVTSRFSGRQTLYAKPRLAEFLNGRFRDEENLSLGQIFFKGVSAFTRGSTHFVLTTGLPGTNIHSFGIGIGLYKPLTTAAGAVLEAPFRALSGDFAGSSTKIREAATALKQSVAFFRSNVTPWSRAFMDEHADDIMNMARAGISMPGRSNSFTKFGDTFWKSMVRSGGDLLGAVKDLPESPGGASKEVLATSFKMFKDSWNKFFALDKTWELMNQQTVTLFGDTLRAAKRGGMEDDEALKFAADITRKGMGFPDTPNSGRSISTEEQLTSIFLVPQYREGVLNILYNGFKGGTWKAGDQGYSFNRSLIIGAVMTYVIYNLINKNVNGYYMWDNPAGREFSVRLPQANGGALYTDMMPSILTIPRNVAEGAIALVKGDWKTAQQKGVSIFSIPLAATYTAFITGKDYFGRDIYLASDSAKVKTEKVLMYWIGQQTSPALTELYKYFTKQQTAAETFVRVIQLPIRFSKAITENYAAVQKIYDNNQKLLASGNAEDRSLVQKTVDGLSEGQYLIYSQIKSAAKAAAAQQRKPEIQKIYDENQRMKAEGNSAEVQKIVDGLSQDDYRIYHAIDLAAQSKAKKSAPSPINK